MHHWWKSESMVLHSLWDACRPWKWIYPPGFIFVSSARLRQVKDEAGLACPLAIFNGDEWESWFFVSVKKSFWWVKEKTERDEWLYITWKCIRASGEVMDSSVVTIFQPKKNKLEVNSHLSHREHRRVWRLYLARDEFNIFIPSLAASFCSKPSWGFFVGRPQPFEDCLPKSVFSKIAVCRERDCAQFTIDLIRC